MVIPTVEREIVLAGGMTVNDMPSVPYGKGDVRKAEGLCLTVMVLTDGWRNIKLYIWAIGSRRSHVLHSCIEG